MLIKRLFFAAQQFLTLIGAFLFVLSFVAPFGFARDRESSGRVPASFTAAAADPPSPTATLGGTVVDEHDAVIPDASVSVIDNGGSLKQQATTGDDGCFTISLIAPGNYKLAVRRQGFVTAEVRDVVLKVNDQLKLRIQLSVGDIGESVTVEAEQAIVKTPTPVATTINRQLAENLPTNLRSIQTLLSLTPGLVMTTSMHSEQGQLSVNGQRANANYFMVDGVSANIGVAASPALGQSGAGSLPGLSVYGGTNNLFAADAMQELKIQTSSYAPEFGRMPGAQVSITTRPGGNQFRATLFEHFRHHALGANDWFANRDNLRKTPFSHHNFGGILSGPVIREQTFYFFSYEGVRSRQPRTTTVDVPSMDARSIAPASVRHLLNAFPVPNGGDTVGGLAKFSAGYTDSSKLNAASLRVDHKTGAGLTLFARYNYAPSHSVRRGADGGGSLNSLLSTSFITQTLTAGVTQVITAGFINDVRINYSRTVGRTGFELDDFGGSIVPTDLMLFPSFATRQDSVYSFKLGGATAFSVGRDVDNLQRQVNLVDQLTIVAGAHQVKLGVDFRRLSPIYGQRRFNQAVNFDGVAGALTGIASSVSILTQDRVASIFNNFSAYAQDTWNVVPRLTVTYGLRFELNPAPSGRDGQELFTVQGVDDPATMSLAPPGTPLYRTTFDNFAPRVGVAYQLHQSRSMETILRAGFGIFYDLGAGPVANSASYFPHVRRKILSNVAYPLDAASIEPRPFNRDLPFGTIRAFDPDFTLPLTAQWNVGVEQSLGAKQNLSASYVGAAGRRLFRSEVFFNPNPNFSQVFVATNRAASDYRALQLQYQCRFAKNLQALSSYVWSHSTDISSNDSSYNFPSGISDPRVDWGPSDFDVRHSLTAAASYNIPVASGVATRHAMLRNWSVDAIFSARTARPVDVFASRDTGFGPFNSRPDVVAGVPLYANSTLEPGSRVINRFAFVLPTTERQGTLRRNSFRGFPFSQLDVALRRQFTLTEHSSIQLRIEFFNVFSRPNFGDPVGDLGSGLFGRSTSMLGRSLGSGGAGAGSVLVQGRRDLDLQRGSRMVIRASGPR